MNFLHIIPSLNPAQGGTVEGLKQLGGALLRLGHQVDVITLDASEEPWISTQKFSNVFALGPARLHYRYSPLLVPWLRKNADKYDAVMVEGLWQYPGFAVWRALRHLRVPYFVFPHGMLSPWFKHAYPLKHLKKWLYWPWAEYQVLKNAKAVLFTSEEERLSSRQSFWLYRCNEVVVGYGTVRSSGDEKVQRETFLSAFPELRDKRIFLFLSRIHEKKGCDLLLNAFSRVASRDAHLRLVLAGPDQSNLKVELVSLAERLGIADKIIWTGMISGDIKWGAYYAAEIFALPSHQENFGVVVAEALSCGLPVLISNKVDIWREVQKTGAGIVADDTLEGAYELLNNWLVMDPVDQSLMRGKATECFMNNFEITRTAQKLQKLVGAEENAT